MKNEIAQFFLYYQKILPWILAEISLFPLRKVFNLSLDSLHPG